MHPEQSQHMKALEKANKIRCTRARTRREVAAGEGNMIALLMDPPPYMQGVKVMDFLTWPHRFGRSTARRVALGIVYRETMVLKDLSPCSRERLGERLSKVLDGPRGRGPAPVAQAEVGEPVAA